MANNELQVTSSAISFGIVHDGYEKAVRAKCRSTYQSDFLPFDPNSVVEIAGNAPTKDCQHDVCFDKSSENRTAFQPPSAQPHKSLQNNTTRYACSEGKVLYKKGIIPGITKDGPYMQSDIRTTYDREVNARALRMFNNAAALEATTIEEHGAFSSDSVEKKLLHEIKLRTRPTTIPTPEEMKTFDNRRLNTPKWISKWPGP